MSAFSCVFSSDNVVSSFRLKPYIPPLANRDKFMACAMHNQYSVRRAMCVLVAWRQTGRQTDRQTDRLKDNKIMNMGASTTHAMKCFMVLEKYAPASAHDPRINRCHNTCHS